MRFLGLVVVALLGLLLTPPDPVAALNLDEWVPGLKLSPFFTERMDYETNVFQVPSHAQGSAIFKTSPGFLADYTFGPHALSVGGRADILRYVSLPAQNTVNYAGVTQLRLEFPRSLLNVRDDVIRTTDPPNSELTGPIVSLTNTLVAESEYHLTDRFSVGALASWIHVSFQEPTVAQDLDRNEYLIGGSLFWKILPRADLQLTPFYQRKVFILSSDRDVTQYGATLGLRGQVTAKLTSTFRIGLLNRDPSTSGQPGYLGVIMGGDLVYTPTERTTVTLAADRSPQESTFNQVPFYVTTSGTLTVSQRFTPKLTVTAKASGGVNDYPEKQETVSGQFKFRQDTFYAFGISADYAIQPWLDVGAEYSFIGRNSNFDQFNFKDNRFTARATVHF
jgi:putative beta-barrel porin BBP2